MSSRRLLRLPALLLAGGTVLVGCTAGGSGQADAPGVSVDWKSVAYGPAGCASRAEWVAEGWSGADWDDRTVTTSRADVTGDDVSEVLVVVACPSAASEPGESVVVLDVSRGEPTALGVLGGDLRLQGATVTTDGTTVTVAGPAGGGEDPACCPGHWASAGYSWTGSRFAPAGSLQVPTTRPVVAGGVADGEHVGLLRAVTADTVYVDLVEWFEGADAAAACAADGVQDNGWEQCGTYHVRDVDDAVRVLPVGAGAAASYVDPWTAEVVAVGTVGALAGTPAVSDAPGEHAYVRLTVAGGEVVTVAGVYVP
jgi:hypothetical protein